jgi:hypothetical protein
MNLLNRKILLILIAFLIQINSQELKKQLEYADRLFELDQFYDAITEYKRVQFFDDSSKYNYNTNLKIALSYKNGAKLEDAEKYIVQAIKYADNKDKNYESMITLARINILQRKNQRATEILNRFLENPEYDEKTNELYYWKGWNYMFADDWEKAAYEFSKLPDAQDLKYICLKTDNEKISVTFAKVISYILPGSGQIYAGEYLSGLMSLAWNVVGGYFTFKAVLDDRVFDALVIANLGWLRFYRGNTENAEKFAVEKNIKTVNKTMEYLQNNYRGIKP